MFTHLHRWLLRGYSDFLWASSSRLETRRKDHQEQLHSSNGTTSSPPESPMMDLTAWPRYRGSRRQVLLEEVAAVERMTITGRRRSGWTGASVLVNSHKHTDTRQLENPCSNILCCCIGTVSKREVSICPQRRRMSSLSFFGLGAKQGRNTHRDDNGRSRLTSTTRFESLMRNLPPECRAFQRSRSYLDQTI